MNAASSQNDFQHSVSQAALNDQWIGANEILPLARELTGQEPPLNVRSLKDKAASGRLPEIELRSGRWGTTRDRLPALLARIGMNMPTTIRSRASRAEQPAVA